MYRLVRLNSEKSSQVSGLGSRIDEALKMDPIMWGKD